MGHGADAERQRRHADELREDENQELGSGNREVHAPPHPRLIFIEPITAVNFAARANIHAQTLLTSRIQGVR